MTSPKVVGRPSLPAVAKSIAAKVKESVYTGILVMVALMRGPAVAQADGAWAGTEGAVGTRDGKADWDSVSRSRVVDLVAVADGVESVKEGKGSGAPSNSCLL